MTTDNSTLQPTVENDSRSHEAGVFTRLQDSRVIRGLLLPFNELSRPNMTNNAPVMFTADAVKLPRDPSVVTLNTEHDRFNPIGRATSLRVTDRGIEAEFAIADTDEGDAYLNNPVRKLSAEVAQLMRDAADNSRAIFSRLTGAAVCAEGAFESAGLFSVAPTDEGEERPVTKAELEEIYARLADAEARLAAANESASHLTPEESDEETEETEPDAVPAQETTQTEMDSPVENETLEAGAQVPATLQNGATAKKTDVDMNAVFSAMAAVKNRTGNTGDSETLLAALADVTTPAHVSSGAIVPTFTGKLWQGKRYTQRYINLANHSQGGIALAGRKGFKLTPGASLVQEVANAGQKVELPTGTASTSTVSSTLRKFGYAADFALEWQYLEGGADVMQAFFEKVVDDGAKVIDEAALATIFNVASRGSGAALSRLVAPATFPAQAGVGTYPQAMGQLIQGIDLVADNGDDATFAIVNQTAWTQLLYTPKDLIPEFVEFGVGLGTGEATAGKVRVVKAPNSFFTGLGAAKPQVIVGAKNAIEFREQHVEIDALEVAKFGIDRATVAFLETFIVREESVSLIGAV